MCCVLKVFTSTFGENTSFIGKVFQTKDTVAQLLSQPKNNSWSRLVHEPEPDFGVSYALTGEFEQHNECVK